jgi:hypothetical protein
MDDVVSTIVRDHADTLCYKVSGPPPFCFKTLFSMEMQDSDQKLVPPRALFAGGINPSGIPVYFVAFAPAASPPAPTRSQLTSVMLSVLQQSNIKSADAEDGVPFTPLNFTGRFY